MRRPPEIWLWVAGALLFPWPLTGTGLPPVADTAALREADPGTPAGRLEALLGRVFVMHKVTADLTTLSADWDLVTGDRANMDPWRLTQHLLELSQQVGWPLEVADSDLGPVVMLGLAARRVGSVVLHGRGGDWARWSPGSELPRPLSAEDWKKILALRRLELQLIQGRHGKPDPAALNLEAPTAARVRLRVDLEIPIELLTAWARRWPRDGFLVAGALAACRHRGDRDAFDALWEAIPLRNETIWIEGALQARGASEPDHAMDRLEKALALNPFHAEALRLWHSWQS